MDLNSSEEDEAFRKEVRDWLHNNLCGEFEILKGRGGPGDEHELLEERKAWGQHLARAGWTCLSWPKEYGGRNATFMQEVIFYEEYAKARGPGHMGHIGETLLGPTIIAYGTEAQKKRFLPKIAAGEEFWCQGYSEPNAGSDLANIQTKAELKNGQWHINGQKIWTSLAHFSEWAFVLCRTNSSAPKHKGISYLLVPMNQSGVTIRPIEQMTATSEFNEVFFDEAQTAEENIVGDVDGGWKIAMATLAFERGASTLGQQHAFQGELDEIIEIAKQNGAAKDPLMRQRLADAWIGLKVMRYNALRTLHHLAAGELTPEAMISKLYWSNWHRDLGKLAMDILGPAGEIAEDFPYRLSKVQNMYLFSRSDTIYAGSNQIQRNIIGERGLGLAREPRPKS